MHPSLLERSSLNVLVLRAVSQGEMRAPEAAAAAVLAVQAQPRSSPLHGLCPRRSRAPWTGLWQAAAAAAMVVARVPEDSTGTAGQTSVYSCIGIDPVV